MSLKKDKEKVLGEVFDDERVKSFLDYQAPNRRKHRLSPARKSLSRYEYR